MVSTRVPGLVSGPDSRFSCLEAVGVPFSPEGEDRSDRDGEGGTEVRKIEVNLL